MFTPKCLILHYDFRMMSKITVFGTKLQLLEGIADITPSLSLPRSVASITIITPLTNRQTDRKTDRHRQIKRQTDIGKEKDRQTSAKKKTDRQTDRGDSLDKLMSFISRSTVMAGKEI
jgi:hypothetical protein